MSVSECQCSWYIFFFLKYVTKLFKSVTIAFQSVFERSKIWQIFTLYHFSAFFQLGCYKNSFFRILSFSLLIFPVSSHFWVFNFFWLRDIFHFSRFANIGEVASGESGQCGSPPCRVVWVQNVISDNLLLWWLKCNWCNIISDAVWCCVHWKSILQVLFLFFVLCLCLCQCQQFLSQTVRYTSMNENI